MSTSIKNHRVPVRSSIGLPILDSCDSLLGLLGLLSLLSLLGLLSMLKILHVLIVLALLLLCIRSTSLFNLPLLFCCLRTRSLLNCRASSSLSLSYCGGTSLQLIDLYACRITKFCLKILSSTLQCSLSTIGRRDTTVKRQVFQIIATSRFSLDLNPSGCNVRRYCGRSSYSTSQGLWLRPS